MAKPRKLWSQLSPDYRNRLKRQGVTAPQFNSGKAHGALKAARGHGQTPEHPERAFHSPHKYPSEYFERRRAKGLHVPEDIGKRRPGGGPFSGTSAPWPQGEPVGDQVRPWSHARIGADIGYPNRDNVQIHYILITKGGAGIHNLNGDLVDVLTLQNEAESNVVYPYDEADWQKLYDLVRAKGFHAFVQSGQYDFKTGQVNYGVTT